MLYGSISRVRYDHIFQCGWSFKDREALLNSTNPKMPSRDTFGPRPRFIKEARLYRQPCQDLCSNSRKPMARLRLQDSLCCQLGRCLPPASLISTKSQRDRVEVTFLDKLGNLSPSEIRTSWTISTRNRILLHNLTSSSFKIQAPQTVSPLLVAR
jgi:hypothetical protein